MTFKCLHISDVHWRGLTRHDEYKQSFAEMFIQARELEPDIIFIGGDIVHSKTQGISPELIDCLTWWLEELASISPVHIILGNHDGLITNKHRQDAISPIVSAIGNPNIHLFKYTGVYPTGIDGINWCVFGCFDEENWDSVEPVPGEINIAVYHGPVHGSKTDVNWSIEGQLKTSFFQDYDFTFLGDIHKLQYLDKEKRIAYPGSAIQQNYGESMGKGFLFWEIDSRDEYKSTFYKIPHYQPFVTVDWAGSVKETMKECRKKPNGSRFRIRVSDPISNAEIKHIHTELKADKAATEIVFKHEFSHELGMVELPDGYKSTKDLRKASTHIELMRDYYSHLGLSNNRWNKLEKLVQKYLQQATQADSSRNIKWSIKKMEFDNMFSYGKGNVINFAKLNGIIGLFGKNRAGKSSIPGSIMYGLYNTTDRGPMSNLHVINMRKGHCRVGLQISANGKLYHLERQSVKRTNKKGEQSVSTQLNLSLVDSEGNVLKDLNGEQRRKTENTVREIIGSSGDFLLTSLASQGGMNTFIKYRATHRKKILTKFLDLEIFKDMLELAKEDSSDIKSMLANAPDHDWDILINRHKNDRDDCLQEREELEGKLDEMRAKLQKAQIALATLDKNNLVTKEDLAGKEQEIEKNKGRLTDARKEYKRLSEEISTINKKLQSISDVREQFPIEELKEKKQAYKDLEWSLNELQHKHTKEKDRLKAQKKSVKLLDEVPCGDQFPMCKFIKNSHSNKKKLDAQSLKVDELLDDIKAAKKSLKSMGGEDLDKNIQKYDDILQKERDLQIEVSNKNVKLNTFDNKVTTLTELVTRQEEEHYDMSLRVSDSDEAGRISKAKKLISSINEKVNALDASRLKLSETIGHLDVKIEKLKEEKEKYVDMIEEWKTYELFINAVSKKGIPLKIMSSQLPHINEEISKILQGVVGFTVELEADPNSNAMDIYINYGDSKRIIECGSGMEKMMASLAIRVALINMTTLPKSDMLIIDEGFGALDEMNVEACGRLLTSLKRWFKNILVISHVDAVKDSADSILDITQEGMNAKVVYD